ncbi:hypothetical protein B484DRAFT_409768, partial [Ochromonadaceae sp. CCMP2298]
ALSAYAKALQLDPRNKEAAAGMAGVLTAQGKLDEAAECLVGVLERVNCHALRLQLGKTYASLGRYQQSVENLHMAASLGKEGGEAETEALQLLLLFVSPTLSDSIFVS